jgi:glucose/arabinose dehydrogenase
VNRALPLSDKCEPRLHGFLGAAIHMGKRIRDVIQAPDGAVLVLVDGDNRELLRLTPASDAATARRF